MQPLPHARKFGLHWQVPPPQNWPRPQALPQLPQLVPSLRSCTQRPLQTVSPAPHLAAQFRRLHT